MIIITNHIDNITINPDGSIIIADNKIKILSVDRIPFDYLNDTNSYNGGNSSPGIRLTEHYFADCNDEGLNNGADKLNTWYEASRKCVIVIVNVGNIHVNSTWLNQFIEFRSWRMTKNVTTSSENWSYAAVITNINDIGQLSEALQGKGTLQDNATAQLVIEHKESTVGHAGYGEDLSSGTGAGAFSYTGTSQSAQTIATRTINWDNAGKDRVNPGEKLRFTFDGKVQQGALHYNGYLKVKLIEPGIGGTSTFTCESCDLYERIEGLHTRVSSVGTGSATLEIEAYAGSGAGAGGSPHTGIYGRTLEVYKAGENPDQDRDVAVHKWHINSLNVAEGPANFDLKVPSQFSAFYSSDRNLADTSQNYTLDTSGTGSGLLNYQSNKLNMNFGSSYSEYDGDHFGKVIWAQNTAGIQVDDRFYDGNGIKKDFSNYVKTTYQLNSKLSLYGDIQLRNVNYKTSGSTSDIANFLINKKYNFFNPKGGFNYLFNNYNNVYFSFARSNREPTRSDYESNPNIRSEQLNDFEFGWSLTKKKFNITTNFYMMQYKDQLVLTGSIDDVGTPVRENSGESYRTGLEVETVFNLSDKISILANSAFSDNKNKNFVTSLNGELVNLGKTNISFSPEIVSSVNLLYSPKENMEFSILNKYVGEQYMSNTDSVFSKLDAYSVLDFNFNCYSIFFQEAIKNQQTKR